MINFLLNIKWMKSLEIHKMHVIENFTYILLCVVVDPSELNDKESEILVNYKNSRHSINERIKIHYYCSKNFNIVKIFTVQNVLKLHLSPNPQAPIRPKKPSKKMH